MQWCRKKEAERQAREARRQARRNDAIQAGMEDEGPAMAADGTEIPDTAKDLEKNMGSKAGGSPTK